MSYRSWEPEEDRVIIELIALLGPRWSKICKALPDRSVASIRNRWLRVEKAHRYPQSGALGGIEMPTSAAPLPCRCVTAAFAYINADC